MVFLKSRAMLGAVVLAVAGTWAEGAERSPPEGWREVFVYCQEVVAGFGEDGEAVVVRREAEPPAPPDPSAPPFDPDGEAAEQASGGDAGRKDAFMAWLEGECAEAGETVLVAGTDEGGVYVLSEHGAAARGLKRYDMAERRAVWVTAPGEARELVGPVFAPGAGGGGGARLAGLVWNSPEGARTEWLDPAMGAVQERLGEAYPGAGFDWVVPSPDGGRWIVRVRYRGRPAEWLCVDAVGASWRVLAECPVEVSPTVRELFRWTASDGMRLTGVYTRPKGEGPFPLVVFPHGGPGALSTEDFDERVWALADAGFAVFQPNYRGSAGFGKAFRFAGWGPEGIRRALLDVREGVAALRADSGARLDDSPPVLLGGSWGGYVAVAELALYPGEWAGAVSFFGAFDLPELVRAEWSRAGEGETAAAAERARRSLRRQFGDPGKVADIEALEAISPVRMAGAIREPVILYHNRGDRVIAFGQSEGMAAALRETGGMVQFRAGEGAHEWTPAEEAGLYASLAITFREWMSVRGQLRKSTRSPGSSPSARGWEGKGRAGGTP